MCVVVRGRMGATHPDLRDPSAVWQWFPREGSSSLGYGSLKHIVSDVPPTSRECSRGGCRTRDKTNEGSHTRHKDRRVRQRSRSPLRTSRTPNEHAHPEGSRGNPSQACIQRPSRHASRVFLSARVRGVQPKPGATGLRLTLSVGPRERGGAG